MKNSCYTIVGLGCVMASCNSGVYVPVYQNVPLFREKGESMIQIGQSNFQGAFAVGNHFGIIANAQRVGELGGRKFLRLNPLTKHKRLEWGAGYFNVLNNKKVSYELYGGVGYGRMDFLVKEYGQYNEAHWKSTNKNAFVQSSMGFRGKHASIALSTKMNAISYNTFQVISKSQVPDSVLKKYSYFYSPVELDFEKVAKSPLLFIEPALTTSVGSDCFRFTMQVFTQFPLVNRNQFSRKFLYPMSFLRFGFSYRIN